MTTLISAFPALLAAPASGGAAQTGSMMTTFITFGLIILVFYFLIIRPQKKKEKEAKAMINAIQKGDKIVTIGGIRGTVIAVKEDVVTVKVDDNAKIDFSKGAISSVIGKKGAKNAEVKKDETAKAPAKKSNAKKVPAKKVPAKKADASAAEQDEIKTKKEEKSNADSEKTE